VAVGGFDEEALFDVDPDRMIEAPDCTRGGEHVLWLEAGRRQTKKALALEYLGGEDSAETRLMVDGVAGLTFSGTPGLAEVVSYSGDRAHYAHFSEKRALSTVNLGSQPTEQRDVGPYAVVVDGEAGPPLGVPTGTIPLTLSATGARCVCSMVVNGTERAVIDGQPVESFELATHVLRAQDAFAISASGGRVAFVAKHPSDPKARCVVADGQAGPQFGDIRSLAFSPDGGHLAYEAQVGRGRWVMVRDDEPGAIYKEIGYPVWSPDGQRLAYLVRASRFGHDSVVVDGELHEGAQGAEFSHDSRHVAYRRKDHEGWHIVVDGEAGPAFEEIMDDFSFREGSSDVSYLAKRDGKWHPVIGGVAGSAFDEVGTNIGFSPRGNLVFIGRQDRKSSLVLDGIPGPDLGEVPGFIFSPDGHRVAYCAVRGRHVVFVVDNEPGPEVRALIGPLWMQLAFSPDSSRLAYVGATEDGQHAFVDHEPSAAFDRISNPTFDNDNRPVFAARRHRTICRLTWTPR